MQRFSSLQLLLLTLPFMFLQTNLMQKITAISRENDQLKVVLSHRRSDFTDTDCCHIWAQGCMGFYFVASQVDRKLNQQSKQHLWWLFSPEFWPNTVLLWIIIILRLDIVFSNQIQYVLQTCQNSSTAHPPCTFWKHYTWLKGYMECTGNTHLERTAAFAHVKEIQQLWCWDVKMVQAVG